MTTETPTDGTLRHLARIKRMCPSIAQPAIMAAELLIEIQQKKIEMLERELMDARKETVSE